MIHSTAVDSHNNKWWEREFIKFKSRQDFVKIFKDANFDLQRLLASTSKLKP